MKGDKSFLWKVATIVYRKSARRFILVVCVLLILTTASVSAYTISRNRIVYSPVPLPTKEGVNVTWTTPTTTTLPQSLTINQSQIKALLNMRPSGEAWAYQAAYQDAIQDVRILLGIKAGKYSTAPQYPRDTMTPELRTCYCYNQTYADFLRPYIGNLTRDPAKFNFSQWK